ncbi:hypothetical protein ACFLSQ_03160, partial [Bacteroidota bacterium]
RTKPHQRVHMISVVMEDNIDEIEDLILLAKEIGVTYLVTLYSNGRRKKEKDFLNRDISSHLLKLKKKYKDFLSLPGYLSKFSEFVHSTEGMSPCCAGKNMYNIDSSGIVRLCIDMLDDPAGNIFQDDINIIKKKLYQKHIENTCSDCWSGCRGPIEALLYDNNKTGNWMAVYQAKKNIPLLKS